MADVKVKSNILEKVVPENLYLIQKQLIYLKQLLRSCAVFLPVVVLALIL